MADHLRASQAKVQIRRAVPAITRRNRGTGDVNLRGSVLRPRQRALVQMSRRLLSVGHHRDFVSPVVLRRVQAVLLMKRAVREKEGRVFAVNLAANHRVERLLQQSKPRRNQRAERKGPKEQRHRQGRNNFSVTNTSGSGM